MNKAYLLTGGNLGNRKAMLHRAVKIIRERCGNVEQLSAIYETEPWGKNNQAPFLNQALELDTPLDARDLMNTLLEIEEEMGRHREEKYGPRLIDIDILFFNEDVVDKPELRIPHPELPRRRFALEPLAEIAPGRKHPVLHKTVSMLLAECKDPLAVKKYDSG